jgi:hypothetical protein
VAEPDDLPALYGGVEVRLFGELARRLSVGMGAPGWVERQLGQFAAVRRFTDRLIADAGRRAGGVIEGFLVARFRAGTGAAPTWSDDQARRVLAPQIQDTRGRVAAAHARLATYAVDVYRAATAAGIGLDGRGETALARRRSVQRALNRAADQGIAGFVDRRGRAWNLAGYLEMCAVTAAKQAEVTGQLAQMEREGRNLLLVRGGPQECPRCRPWFGKIVTRDDSGAGGRVLVMPADASPDRMVTVRVAGSLGEARSRGLLHPRCRCRLITFLPGLTPVGRIPGDPRGQQARDRLRALERRVRELRRREAAALDDDARRAVAAQVRAKQAEIAAHVASSPGLRRDPRRERPDLGYRVSA